MHGRFFVLRRANVEVEPALVELHQVDLAIVRPAHLLRVGSNHPECGPGSGFASKSETRTATHIDAVSLLAHS
eukprot:3180047-Prymnesium_polylepis.2